MKIKILGKTWEVKEVTAKEIGEVSATDKRYTMGACDMEDKRILILKDLREEVKQQTIIHELTHAILDESSINTHLTLEQQEQYCEFIKFAYPIINDALYQVVKKGGLTPCLN